VQQAERGPDIYLQDVRLALGARGFQFDLTLRGGAITAVIGPSGSGKSTLLNLVAGFVFPKSGRIVIGLEDLTPAHPARRPVSLVFQDNNLFGHLDLYTNVGLGISPSLKLSKEQRLEVSAALSRVGLGGMEKRKPSTLSGGERQRAAFARALVRHKPVLLLDEPFAALDPGLRLNMTALLTDLQGERRNTVLIVTHDPDEVTRLADDVLFIEDGRVVLQAPAAELDARRDIPAIASFLDG
jgi:thiamine transport system ATP-binding protein